MNIIHTSSTKIGQISIPQVNNLLMVACLGLVVSFRSSANLAATYGVALSMTITTVLFAVVWFPLLVAALVYAMMSTWKSGRARLSAIIRENTLPMDIFLQDIARRKPHRVPGTAVFLTSDTSGAPPVLLHHLKHNQVLHEKVMLLSITTEEIPQVDGALAKEAIHLHDPERPVGHRILRPAAESRRRARRPDSVLTR